MLYIFLLYWMQTTCNSDFSKSNKIIQVILETGLYLRYSYSENNKYEDNGHSLTHRQQEKIAKTKGKETLMCYIIPEGDMF